MKTSKEEPLVSVIVTTYNRKELLKKTIDSILNQTFRKFELIVVDDGSTDNTKSILEAFEDPRIQYIYTDNWGGPARARNIGINKAKGEYIAFCDDDDIWYPDKLGCQLRELNNSSYGLCFTNFDYINEDGKKLEKKHKIKNRFLNLSFNNFILGGGGICNSAVMIIRDVINTVGLFKEDSQLISVEDYHYWARILKKYKACCVNKVLVSYRTNSPNSIQVFKGAHWLNKQMYLLNSINSSAKINRVIYYIKFFKLIAVDGLTKITHRG